MAEALLTQELITGDVVRDASRAGIPGLGLTADLINQAALGRTGASWGLLDSDLEAVLDPGRIVASRQAVGGAAPEAVEPMLRDSAADAATVAAHAATRLTAFAAVESELVARARALVGADTDHAPKSGGSP